MITLSIIAFFTFLLGFVGTLGWLFLCEQLGARQVVRAEGPQHHQRKTGTPSMGGIAILLTFLVSFCIVVPDLFTCFDVLGVLLLTIGYGVIGALDDGLKMVRKQNQGLYGWQKLLGQGLLGGGILLFLEQTTSLFSTLQIQAIFPGLPPWLLYGYGLLILVGTANAVNLSDGLDGLATGLLLIALLFFFILLWPSHMALLAWVMIFVLVAFFSFNRHPARLFMGDVGSLALGGMLGSVALFSGWDLVLIPIGIVFVMEALSVMIQVVSFKCFGKRIFKMSPYHHHLELSGYSEQHVVTRLWFTGAVVGGIFVILVKYIL